MLNASFDSMKLPKEWYADNDFIDFEEISSVISSSLCRLSYIHAVLLLCRGDNVTYGSVTLYTTYVFTLKYCQLFGQRSSCIAQLANTNHLVLRNEGGNNNILPPSLNKFPFLQYMFSIFISLITY